MVVKKEREQYMIKEIKIGMVFPVIALYVGACATAPASTMTTAMPTPASPSSDLGSVQTYVEEHANGLHTSIRQLKDASDQYYDLARNTGFDYERLWAEQSTAVLAVLDQARAAFMAANPQYEQMEGVVAGVPSLSQYDLILDAGTPGSAGGEGEVPFDLTLPDGRVLQKPGNLFEVTEATLWGTDPQYTIPDIHPDFNGDGQVDLGDALPDANVLKGTADTFEKYTTDLSGAAKVWQPTPTEAFGALVANVPTFTDFMESWRNSRFVEGSASKERGFVATSRLSDLSDNILSWQKIYAGVSPEVQTVAPDQDAEITRGLGDLQKYVSDLYAQESQGGKRFTPEEVDILNAEGQRRAAAIAGQVAQVAARLGVVLTSE
jgi:hypothetical protein